MLFHIKNSQGLSFTISEDRITVEDRFQREVRGISKVIFPEGDRIAYLSSLEKESQDCGKTYKIQHYKEQGLVVIGPYGLPGGGLKKVGAVVSSVVQVCGGFFAGGFMGTGLVASGLRTMSYALRTPEEQISFDDVCQEGFLGFMNGVSTSVAIFTPHSIAGAAFIAASATFYESLSDLILGERGANAKDVGLDVLTSGAAGACSRAALEALPIAESLGQDLLVGSVAGAAGGAGARILINLIRQKCIWDKMNISLVNSAISGLDMGLIQQIKRGFYFSPAPMPKPFGPERLIVYGKTNTWEEVFEYITEREKGIIANAEYWHEIEISRSLERFTCKFAGQMIYLLSQFFIAMPPYYYMKKMAGPLPGLLGTLYILFATSEASKGWALNLQKDCQILANFKPI